MSSIFFDNFNFQGEQGLFEDLICEYISQYGIDVYYIPRILNNYDPELRESSLQTFGPGISLCVYIRDVQGFTGDGKFLSKFGLEIRDEMTFSITMRSFAELVQTATNQVRPNEGDLIYFPLNGKCFSLKFVDQEAVFYQLGKLNFWDVVCELFEYSNETFATGISEIDDKYNALNTDNEPEGAENISDDQSNTFVGELTANNVVDWSEDDPFSEGQYQGQFSNTGG